MAYGYHGIIKLKAIRLFSRIF